MLRALVLLLLLANAFWWAASHGWLPASWLPLPDDAAQREPQRLAQQLRPENVIVLPAAAAARAPAAPECLQSAAYADPGALAAAEAALLAAGLGAGRWQRIDGAAGTVLRIEGVDERSAAAIGLAQREGPVFSPCP